ncbi:MAG: tol-pal system protein YbgF [Deltaproteobacteria bacterium HGW-Deltaproteobacteria-17]|nr:MAG: tol-pal system protein YbgF [Deltaproteobacteria bacterium HGW-Deltaproteobacteria-17]
MRVILALFLFWSMLGGLASCTGTSTRLETTLRKLTAEQKSVSLQLETLTRRLAVLESRVAIRGGKPKEPGRSRVGTRELGPEELPKVTLRPPVSQPASIPEPPPEPQTEEDVVSSGREEPVEDEDPPPPSGQKRIVLRLQGEPSGADPVSAPGGPVLPLGKYAPLKEPEESTHHPSDKAPAKPAVRPASGAEGLYQTAMDHFEQGRYALALTWFARVEKEHPGHALVPNAIFWQGECHFQSGRYPLAINQYQRLISAYPKSSKVIDAMYKLGIALDKNGNTTKAREMLSRVVELVPQTPTAAKAAAYLQKMR